MEIKPRHLCTALALLNPTIYLMTRGRGELFIYLNWALGIIFVLAFFASFIIRTKKNKKTDYYSLFGIIITILLLIASLQLAR